jgi:hypothetical protein
MSNLKIKSQSSPRRCEICHQSDLFNTETNYCSRCEMIDIDKDDLASAKMHLGQRDYGRVGLIIGAISGALIGITCAFMKGLSLIQLASYQGIIGLVILCAIWGAMIGEGFDRLYKS